MKNLKHKVILIIGLLVAGAITLSAQNFEGKATYQSARKMDGIGFKGEGMSPEMEKQLKKQIANQFQREYELVFNLSESVWEGSTKACSGGMIIQMSILGGVVNF